MNMLSNLKYYSFSYRHWMRCLLALLAAVALLAGCGGGGNSASAVLSNTALTQDASYSSTLTGSLAGQFFCPKAISGLFPGVTSVSANTSVCGFTAVNNIANLVIDTGPASLNTNGASGISNVAFTTVTVCVPGSTTNCTAVDHVIVDTGSQGLRLVAGALPTSFINALPLQKSGSNPVLECLEFVNSYVWGPVATADFTVAGETASAMPLQLIGASGYPKAPTVCSNGFTATNTVATFGGNGIIGIGTFPNDCGGFCAQSSAIQTSNINSLPGASYWICPTASTCSLVSESELASSANAQVPNPITRFASDNNGSLIKLPSVTATGQASTTGSLIFGIGTQSNNALGSAKILTVDPNYGTFSTAFNGTSFPYSYVDSGTSVLVFDTSTIPVCTDATWAGFFCPKSTLALSATNTSYNLATSTVAFSVGNADSMNLSYAVLPQLAAPSNTSGQIGQTFAWGLPFFYGRTVFNAIEGYSTPAGNGPFVAY